MGTLIVFLLLVNCRPSASIGPYDRENGRLQLRSNEFFHQIREWFNRMKDHIRDKLSGQTATTLSPMILELPSEVLDLDTFQLPRRLKNREWLHIDLSTLSFDPDRDWGFRIGNWYFIRKGVRIPKSFVEDNSDESDELQTTVQPISTTESETRHTLVDTNDSEAMEPLSITTDFMMQTVTQSVTETNAQAIQTSTQIDLSKNTSQTLKHVEDNETNNDSIRKGSVEVLMG